MLARHSALLEQHTGDPRARRSSGCCRCASSPRSASDLFERAAALATLAQAHAELIWLYETLAQYAENPEERVHYLVSAARVADIGLEDREHAVRDMTRALTLTEHAPKLGHGDRRPGARARQDAARSRAA